MNADDLTIDLFAGPGGWDEGARMLGLPGRVLGIEWDEAACATALAAGHDRYRADLSMVAVDKFGPFRGLIASPPCQAYSTAGKGLGKLDKPRILRHVERIRDAGRWLHYSREGWHDERSPLVLETLRWALLGHPEWVACEQVPTVLPLWQAFAEVLTDHGYSTAVGKLSAEQYGVPQTRQRAILVASRVGVATLPRPTHQAYTKRRPFDPASPLPRWVSMAEALGWTGRGFAMTKRCGAGMAERYGERPNREGDEPAFTLTTGGGEGGGTGHVPLLIARFGNQEHSAVREVDEPAATIRYSERANALDWVMRGGAQSKATERSIYTPAPTVVGGHDTANRVWSVMNAAGATGLAPRETSEPAATITGKGTAAWTHGAPATTVQGDPRIAPRGHHDRQFSGETVRVTVDEAARLQSFPVGYPWNGGPKDSVTKKYEQVGNAIPPLLAAAVLGNLLGIDGWRDVCASMRPPLPSVNEAIA